MRKILQAKVHKYSKSKMEITDPQRATIGKLFRKISREFFMYKEKSSCFVFQKG